MYDCVNNEHQLSITRVDFIVNFTSPQERTK